MPDRRWRTTRRRRPPRARPRSSPLTSASRRHRDRVRMSEVDRHDRADVRARRDRHVRRRPARATRSRRARRRPTDRPTPRPGPASRGSPARATSMSTSTAPEPSSWNTTSDASRARGIAQRLLDQRRVRRIDQPVDLHDDDAAAPRVAVPRATARRRVRAPAPTTTRTSATSTSAADGDGAESDVGGSHRPLVACRDGGCAVLLHLPRRHRRGQGRRREDDRDGRAGGDRGARRLERAHRRGRGQIGAADDVRRAGALLRRARPRSRRPRPLPHARRRARRLPRDARDAAHLEAADRVGRARGRRDRGAGDEGHPRARQGEVARRDRAPPT